jgi:peptidoglycan/xylan/chitin deacetylase (PgdA/CDA1 family)
MSGPLILMYHRVAEEPTDHWGLAVSAENFAEHLDLLSRTRHPVPLLQFVDRMIAGTLPPDAVALTFDDGYVDNLTAAMPLLAAAGVPATVFLATGFIGNLAPFWWDELARLVLGTDAPRCFEFELSGTLVKFDCGHDAEDRVRARAAMLERLYHPLRRLDAEARSVKMGELRESLGVKSCLPELGRPMTSDEVRAIGADGLVTIGAHSITHPLLPELDGAALQREIAGSKLACEALTGAPVRAFAYPFGEFDAAVCNSVAGSGFSFACSTGRAPTLCAAERFALRRIYIRNLSGDAFAQRIAVA